MVGTLLLAGIPVAGPEVARRRQAKFLQRVGAKTKRGERPAPLSRKDFATACCKNGTPLRPYRRPRVRVGATERPAAAAAECQGKFLQRVAAKTKRGTGAYRFCARPLRKCWLIWPRIFDARCHVNFIRVQPVENLLKVGGSPARTFTERMRCASDATHRGRGQGSGVFEQAQ